MRSPPGPVGRPSRRTRDTEVLGAAAVVLAVLYAAIPAARDGLWIALGVWSATAILVGVRRFRPSHAGAWYLLVGATLAFAAAPVGLLGSVEGDAFTLPAGTDWISIAAYPLAAAGLLIMVRHRLVRKDVAGLLDALIAVSAVTFLIWAFVISPYVHLAGTPPGYRRSTMVYPVGDLLLLGIFARLLLVPAARTRSLALLAAGMIAMTISDVCETLWLLHTVHWFDDGHFVLLLDAGWIAFWVFWGFAALTPSMRESTRPVAVSEYASAPIRLWVLATAAVLTPIAGAAEVIRGDETTQWIWPLLAAGVFLLILWRLSLVLSDHRRALERERILLDASETLVAAAGADQVAAALASGATRLLGRRTEHEVVVAVDGGTEMLVTVAGAGPARREGWQRWQAWRWGSRGRRNALRRGAVAENAMAVAVATRSEETERAGGSGGLREEAGEHERPTLTAERTGPRSTFAHPALPGHSAEPNAFEAPPPLPSGTGDDDAAPIPPNDTETDAPPPLPPGPGPVQPDAAEPALESAASSSSATPGPVPEPSEPAEPAANTASPAANTASPAATPTRPAAAPESPPSPDPALRAGTPAWRAAIAALAEGIPLADPAHGAAHLPDVHHTEVLPAPLADQLAGYGHALVLPLGVEDWSAGMLAVGADEEDLILLGTPVELLCRQAALTLHRISLGQEIAQRDSEAYFRALVQNTSDAILIVDPGRHVRYASPSALALFEHDDLLGRDLGDLIGPVYAADVTAWGSEPATRESIRRDWELPMPSGLVHEVEATVADLRAEPTVGGFVVSLHDVTTARGLERTLQRHAYHDPLTGLPNRLAFSRGLDDALELASPEVTVSVIMLDIDHFREVNDFHGREAGDDALRATTRLLRSAIEPGDVLARVGGDEFAVLQVRSADETPTLPLGMPGEQGAYFVGSVPITTSGALATGTPESTGGSLLADVEMTLHAAKAAGVHSWRRYDPELRAELALAAARRSGLDQALREESFELVYQPLVWLDDGDVGGFESLVRWPQPDGGVIMPDEFIPLAEATGQILPLGRWILRTATAQAAEWNRLRAARGAPPVKVSVNVSAHELRDPLFPTIVYEALKGADLDPSYLILEATESALIHHAGTALANLRLLARAGIGVALDDFGTGYSSLSYLRDLPVSSLKIDKLFVDGVPEIRRQTALVRGIIGIAKSLDLLVIAEGIENPVQSDMLLAMGADIGQGYLFSPPMSKAAALELMSSGVVDLLEHGAGGQGGKGRTGIVAVPPAAAGRGAGPEGRPDHPERRDHLDHPDRQDSPPEPGHA